jgi:hypothetical protein
MIRMSEIQNQKKQNKKEEMMGVTKVVLVGSAIMLGLAATVGWLSQEAEAAKCLDCDLRQEPSYGPPTCATRCAIVDDEYLGGPFETRPMPGLGSN